MFEHNFKGVLIDSYSTSYSTFTIDSEVLFELGALDLVLSRGPKLVF